MTVGCTKIKFTPYSGSTHPTFTVSTCVSERIGTHAFDDASYAAPAAWSGWVYPPSERQQPCINATVQPLSSDKTALHTEIATLTAAGSTAGRSASSGAGT